MNGLIISLVSPHLGFLTCVQSAMGQEDNSARIGFALLLFDGWFKQVGGHGYSLNFAPQCFIIHLASPCLFLWWLTVPREQATLVSSAILLSPKTYKHMHKHACACVCTHAHTHTH